MCGIAAIISTHPDRLQPEKLEAMTSALAHRGPDGQGRWADPGGLALLGHRRLAIIDLSEQAAQPMQYLDRYIISYNGEIYNYLELKAELAAKGYRFRTASDTEVILAAFDYWQEGCPARLDGMFAFIIWDRQSRTLFGARDRLGEKPLYYHLDPGGHTLQLASEPAAFWAAGLQRRINQKMLGNFISLGISHNAADPGETFFEGLRKLPAAQYFYYQPLKGLWKQESYWELQAPEPANVNIEEAREKFSGLLEKSIRQRLRSDVALGTSLSGGLDSSTIAALIGKINPAEKGFLTFSAVFPGFERDESRHIDLLAGELGLTNFKVSPQAGDFAADFGELCRVQQEPFPSASLYAQYRVFRLAADHKVKVLLDGQGADEVLAGYEKYYRRYWEELLRRDPALLAREIPAARQLGITVPWNLKNRLMARYPRQGQAWMKHKRGRAQFLRSGLSADFVAAYGQSYYDPGPLQGLNPALLNSTVGGDLEELLRFADRNSMAHGSEVRLPFLQPELLSFLFSLPPSLKIRDGWTKWLLRKSMTGLLPEPVCWRTDKVGYEPPQKSWLQQGLLQQMLTEARQTLQREKILAPGKPSALQALDAHAADNFSWRYLVAAQLG